MSNVNNDWKPYELTHIAQREDLTLPIAKVGN